MIYRELSFKMNQKAFKHNNFYKTTKRRANMDKTTKIVPESLYLCKINNYEYILSVIVHIFYNFCTNFGPKLVKNV